MGSSSEVGYCGAAKSSPVLPLGAANLSESMRKQAWSIVVLLAATWTTVVVAWAFAAWLVSLEPIRSAVLFASYWVLWALWILGLG